MQTRFFDTTTSMFMECDTDAQGACTLCGVHTTRPHAHPQYLMSMWFPPVAVPEDTKEMTTIPTLHETPTAPHGGDTTMAKPTPCQHCGTILTDEQVQRACEDANLVDIELRFLCSEYEASTDTCPGNDPDMPASWRTA